MADAAPEISEETEGKREEKLMKEWYPELRELPEHPVNYTLERDTVPPAQKSAPKVSPVEDI